MRAISGSLAAFITFVLASVAAAGDTASLDILGYSPDGKVFAFEEYGQQDGSGFAYSSIFFLDITADKFLAGTPIRVRIDDEESIAKIRGIARAKAGPLIDQYRLTENPGVMVAYNPPSEVDSDPHKVRYYPYLSAQPGGLTNTLELKTRDFPPSQDCLNMTGSYVGFTLTLTEYQAQPFDKVLHADSTVPKSRNCPNEYRIGAVVSSEAAEATPIAMIMVGSFGFEGNDRRWIAVPIQPYGP